MDPLSIAASAIALGQCTRAVRIGIKELLSLLNATDDFLWLLNELSLLHAFLERSRRTLAQEKDSFDNCSSQDCGALRLLIEEVENVVRVLEDLAKSLMHGSKKTSQKHSYDISKRKWFQAKDKITTLRERSRNIRQDLGVWFAMRSSTYGQHQTQLLMELRDVALSGLTGKSQDNVDIDASTARETQGLEKEVKNESCLKPPPEQHRLRERDQGMVRAFQRLSTDNRTYLPDDESPTSTDIGDASLQGEIVSVNMAIIYHCPPSCQCQCHIKYRIHTPTWLRPVLGQLLLQHNISLMMRRPSCDRTGCVSRDSNLICFQFYLPQWLPPRAILASLTWDCGLAGPGASLYLRVPRVFEFDCGINVALIAGNVTVLQQKIATGALRPTDVDSLSGETVLTYAMRHGHPKIWHALMSLGFDARLKDLGSGRCALDWVGQYGALGAKLPTDFERDVFGMMKTEPSTRNQSTIIHDAIRGRGEADIHESIVKQPDALKKADGLGNAPLHLAVMLRDLRAVKALLDCGANVNQPNSQTYETPLHLSCGLQLYEISEILLDRGADANLRDYRRRTALHHCPPLAKFVRLLASHGADVNARDTSLTSPLQLAMEYGSRFWRVDFSLRRAFVMEMVKAHVDLESQNKWGATALLMAAALDAPMVPVLLELGAKVHDRGTIIIVQRGIEDVNMLHVLAQNPHARIPNKWTSLLHNFLGVDPDRSSSSTMYLSPLKFLRDSSDFNSAWDVGDVLAFTELIINIREMNWNAGLFLESQHTYREDGSHARMKRWINAVSHAISEKRGCGCLKREGEGMETVDCKENEKEVAHCEAEIFYDAVDYV